MEDFFADDTETEGLPPALAEEIVFLISKEKFLVRDGDGNWDMDNPIGAFAAQHFVAKRLGIQLADARPILQSGRYQIVDTIDVVPGQPPLAKVDGRTVVNLWVAPTLQLSPGPYPRIERVLGWLTNDDAGAIHWLKHWLAVKVQHPDALPKVAVVSSTRPGGGKGTLAYAVGQILGPKNCTQIEHGDLTRQFNGRWAEKLFVLADEVVTRDNVEWVSERLKIFIDSAYIASERKGINQILVKNRLAWFFASNDSVTPVLVGHGDRRYTVLRNQADIPVEYAEMLQGCFMASDKSQATPEFMAEIAGFGHELANMEIDYKLVSRPYDNDARSGLMSASASAIDQFQKDILEEQGLLDDLVDWVVDNDQHVVASKRNEWDFGDAIASGVFYRIFAAYCARSGTKAVRQNKFGQALTGNPKFARVRKRAGEKQVIAYQAAFPRRTDEKKGLRAVEGGK